MPKHDVTNKECGMNQHNWRDERFCSCPSQSKQSQGVTTREEFKWCDCGKCDGTGRVPKATEEKLDLGDDDFRECPVPAPKVKAPIIEHGYCQVAVHLEPVPADNKDEGKLEAELRYMCETPHVSLEDAKDWLIEHFRISVAQAEKRGAEAEGKRILREVQEVSYYDVFGEGVYFTKRLLSIINNGKA